MDGEAFFDDLYSQFCVPFPVYAVDRRGVGLVTEPATDGTTSLVLLTDDDLLDRYLAARPGPRLTAVRVGTAARLARVLDRLPKEVTHITFDPQPKFHRRFPLTALRERLPDATV
ncbi:MAG: hypothetical protein U0871_22475 [Gemmataceae bacterium]